MADLGASLGDTTLLDPATVMAPSLLRLRVPQAYTDEGFAWLKRSIAHLGGNVQPVKVRPLEPGKFELVFGSRRLRACLELGLPVSAVIAHVDGCRQVVELDASNDDSQVSAFERGCLYEAALEAGYFPSRRRLAEALGRSLREVVDAVTVAQLPRHVLAHLPDPRSLKAGAAKRLATAMAADPEGLERRLACANLGQHANVNAILKALRGAATKA